MPAPLTGTNLIRPSNASTIASLCWTVGSASSSRGQATSRPGTGTFWKEAGHRTANGCWGMGAKLLHWSSTQPLQSRCIGSVFSQGLQTSQAGGTNGGSTFPRLRWSGETPKCHPVLSGSRVVLFFFFPSWELGYRPSQVFQSRRAAHAPRAGPTTPEGKTSVYSNFPK